MTEFCRSDAAYVLGALSPADRRAFEDHLRACENCQATVQELAGMPGLLALAQPDPADHPPVPSSLLPSLTARVLRHRRRRVRVISGLLAACFVVLVALLGSLVFQVSQTPSVTTAEAVDETDDMAAVVPGPMSASLELVDKRWGTAITVICHYDQDIDTSLSYDLTVIDLQGHPIPGGTWRAVPGVTSRVNTATAVPRDQIAAFEINLPDGRTILRSSR